MAPTRLLAQLFYELRAKTTGLQQDLKGAESQFGKLSQFVKANPVAAMTALGVAVAGVALKAAKMASEVETSLRRVGNSVPDGIKGLDKLREGIEDVSKATGKTQAELARNLQEIAEAGVEGPEQAVARLKVVQTAVDATGAEFSAVVEGLDQTLDLFGGTTEDAGRALGTLFAAAKGSTSLTDLFASFQAAAPTIRDFHLDLDTSARALAALGNSGLNTKKAAAELKRLAEAGAEGRAEIQRLADTIPATADGYADLTRAAREFNNTAEQLNARALAEFQSVMIDIGRAILPGVTRELRNILDLVQRITGTKAKQQSAQGLSDLGKQLANVQFEDAGQILGRRSGEFVTAAKKLAKILADGQGEIVATTAEGAQAVAEGVQRLVDVGLLKADEVKETLAQLDKLAAKTRQGSSTTPLVGGSGGGRTARDIEDQGKAAEKARDAINDLAEKLEKLGTVQELTSGQATLSASAYADFAAEIVKARAKFPQFSGDLTEMSKRLVELRAAASAFEGAELAREIEGLLASFTTTTVDDLEIALRALQKRLKERGATDEQLKQITELEEAFIKAREQSEKLDAALANGRNGGITPLREMVGLLQQLTDAERQLQEVQAKGPQHNREVKELLEIIIKLKQRIKELEEQNAEKTKKTEEATEGFAKALSNAADIAFGLASILFGANSTITKMIAGVGQIADGFEKIGGLGGFGSIFKDGASLLKALPAIGQIIGGGIAVGKLLFGEDADQKANREATEKLTARLRELTSKIGDLIGSNITGSTLGAVRRIAANVDTSGVGGINANAEVFRRVAAEAKKAGLSMEDFIKAAKDLGFDLTRFTVEGFKAFQKGLRDIDFSLFFDTFAGQLEQLDITNVIHGITDPIEILIQKAALLSKVSPAFAEIFKDLDLATVSGRTEAVKRLREQWDRFMENPKEFEAALEASGLSLAEWKQQMIEMGQVLSDAAIAAARFNESLSDIDRELEIAGITDPVARARGAAGAAAGADERFAPLLGFNLGTAEGRAQAEQFLKGLSIGVDDETQEIILSILRAIRAIPEAIGDNKTPGEVEIVGRAAQGLLETTGQSLATFARSGLILDRERNVILENIRDLIAPTGAFAPVRPPTFSASLGATATVVSGGVTIGRVDLGGVSVNATPGESAEETALRFSQTAVEALWRQLSPVAAREQRATARAQQGIVRVAG